MILNMNVFNIYLGSLNRFMLIIATFSTTCINILIKDCACSNRNLARKSINSLLTK